ncbi:MAG: bifunctional demethylmenaquinone methyltransferase/2-methoxy-6-polyprenyl-1,4-benzoquinol methylase UbiE [Bacteroidetes bacterium]|nr:bifunctional demethylmenaquinone methyltransferase/2-methoxy-6-polyprenyl-1,4-benzoquinol methylase UbiE [Bacteroidota bacterium]
MQHDSITPYKSDSEKHVQIAKMFDNISNKYDALNSILSIGIHKGWRKKCVNRLKILQPQHILDVATGTADFAIECSKLHPKKVIGIDISEGMLNIGRKKIQDKKLDTIISLQQSNAETADFTDSSFDAIVIGFGVRNFQNLEKGLTNLQRMLKPEGKLIILEFSFPKNTIVKWFYNFYLFKLTPFVGKLVSKDNRAYTYLAESIEAFPNNEKLVAILKNCGFTKASYNSLFFGVSAIYEASK